MMLKSQAKLDMTFGSFYEIYEADKASRLKRSTWETKSHIIRTKILPYFAERKINEIEVRDVIAWRNELLAAFKDEGKEEKYSQDYLRTIQAQLTAIFAHAVLEMLFVDCQKIHMRDYLLIYQMTIWLCRINQKKRKNLYIYQMHLRVKKQQRYLHFYWHMENNLCY